MSSIEKINVGGTEYAVATNFTLLGSVVADGVKTCDQLLAETYQYINSDKCVLKLSDYYFTIDNHVGDIYEFSGITNPSITQTVLTSMHVANTSANCTRRVTVLSSTGVSISDQTTRVFDNGTTFSILV